MFLFVYNPYFIGKGILSICNKVFVIVLQSAVRTLISYIIVFFSLRGLNIHQENVECLAKNCPNLEHLDLSECMRLSSISSDTVSISVICPSSYPSILLFFFSLNSLHIN